MPEKQGCFQDLFKTREWNIGKMEEGSSGSGAGAQKLRMIWSAAASGIPCDAAFAKSRKAVPPVGCHRTPEKCFFVIFVCFVGKI
jgi:hypothetical protein